MQHIGHRQKFFLLLGMAGICVAASFYLANRPDAVSRFTLALANKRKVFQAEYNRPLALIQDLENQGHFLSLTNPSSATVLVKEPAVFYSIGKIEQEINPADHETYDVKIGRILKFVEDKRIHTFPLYESSELHNPVYFFNVYGCGFCDDAAQNMALLAQHMGYDTQTHWLGGHVVTSIRHDGDWRVYDPDALDGLGAVKVDNHAATMDEMFKLAQENRLARYNEEYRTTENNRVVPIMERWETPAPTLELYPHEKRLFFKSLHMLSNGGNYLAQFKTAEDYFLAYQDAIANFVRVIPLSSLEVIDNQIVLTDYFPFCGLFIMIPKACKNLPEYPAAKMDTDVQITEPNPAPLHVEIEETDFMYEGKTHRFMDLSFCLKNLEYRPSHTVRISKIRTLSTINDVKILSVHYYGKTNADFSEKALRELKQARLEVENR